MNSHPPTYSTSAYNPHATTHYGTSYLGISSRNSSLLRTHSLQAPTIIAPTGQEEATDQQPRRVVVGRQNRQIIHCTEGHSSRSNDSGSMDRNAIHIAKLFSPKEKKYSGNDDEGYEEFVDQYLVASQDLCLSSLERLQFLHILFQGEALRF